VRWRGKVTARFSEPYTFYAATDDGDRLFIAGQIVIDHFVNHSVTEDATKPIMLTAGKPVDIVLEYFQGGLYASAVLSWSSAHEPKAVIPTSALAPQ
ncbi:MAG TPA: PA14 domain-containing protein, partial [Polyangia bacterium]|nr:PA14 domain-containing protein [Polyangia bacterium]